MCAESDDFGIGLSPTTAKAETRPDATGPGNLGQDGRAHRIGQRVQDRGWLHVFDRGMDKGSHDFLHMGP